MQHFTRTQEAEGWSADLRITKRADGSITVQNLKDSAQTENYEDMDDCVEGFVGLLRTQNPSS